MAHVNRRIGKSSETAIDTADGTGGGVLDAFIHDYFNRSGNVVNVPGAIPVNDGLTATGGVISDYVTTPGDIYRAHIFTSSGTFSITEIGDYPANVEYLVVAGGGGGGCNKSGPPNGYGGGGGGAGGLRTNLSGHPLAGSAFPVSTSPGSYSVTVGAGGNGGPSITVPGSNGNNSSFGPITSHGGGYGASNNNAFPSAPVPAQYKGGTGGSGGGGVEHSSGSAGNTPPSSPPQGNPGGITNSSSTPGYPYIGGGGGGASTAGQNGVLGGNGGAGVQVAIAGPAPATTGVGALNPGPGEYQWFAGGGGGTAAPGFSQPASAPTIMQGGVGGGGTGGSVKTTASDAQSSTGGGGGGNSGNSGKSGGSGIVIVRYQIGSVVSEKATGGSVSYYNGKTIHTFVSSGTFTNTTDSNLTVDHIIIAGGGAGGATYHGAGGGAGGVRTSIPGIMPATADSQVVVSPGSPNAVTVTIGAGGKGVYQNTGTDGGNSSFGPLVANGGGGGGGAEPSPSRDGRPGGSGGGSGQGSTSGVAGASANPNSNPTRQGYPGGDAGGHPGGGWCGAGGGGGAGGAGSNGDNGTGSPNAATAGGGGGIGIQLPSAFRDPTSGVGAPGPNSEGFWFAGGGGGTGAVQALPASAYGRGGTGTPGDSSPGPFAGGGNASYSQGSDGLQNTGGGGGGSERVPGPPNSFYPGGRGGSGIIFIAYPS